MKLLYFVSPYQVAEMLMVVPDEYDLDRATKKAQDRMPGAQLENYYEFLGDAVMPEDGRPFVG